MNYKSIFIFEDKAPVANVLKSILIDEGYKVEVSLTTDFLMEKVSKFQPNLIIMNWKISPLSGEQAIKIIREKSNIPIILTSASASLEDLRLSGADAFITKPINILDLLTLVQTFTNSN